MNAHRSRFSGLLLAIAASFSVSCGAANTNGVPPPPGQGQLAIALVRSLTQLPRLTARSAVRGLLGRRRDR